MSFVNYIYPSDESVVLSKALIKRFNMSIIEEKQEQLNTRLAEAKRLHNTGDLSGALKAYRSAIKFAHDSSVAEDIQQHIDELHDMVAFVETIQEDDKRPIKELVLDWVKDNTIAIFAALILISAITLIALLFPILINLVSSPETPQPEPSINQEELPDSYEGGDTSAPIDDLKGNLEDTGLVIEESSTRISLSIPSKFLSPYPVRYVIRNEAPVYERPQQIKVPRYKLALNTPVSLHDKTSDEKWLKVSVNDTYEGWIAAEFLADKRYISPQELDQAIKSALGNRYWQIQVKGQSAPYSYSILINAPDAETAYQAISEAYQSFTSRQMVHMLNTYSHQKIKDIELKVQEKKLDNTHLHLVFQLTKVLNNGTKIKTGQASFDIPKRNDGRYFLHQALEGL